jgi:Putative MetA-pathway of phenol degradation
MRMLIQFFRRFFGLPVRSRKRKRTMMILSALLLAAPIVAQTPQAEAESPIQDNSFLIEEAYNQDPGVVQHIQTFSRATRGGDWLYTFTQEWPAPGIKHQLSYTLAMAQVDGERGIGDMALNYRYQWIGDADARLAVSPRITLLLPTGNERRGFGSGGTGVQVMLPVSTVLTPSLVAHWNLSATLTPKTHTHNITAGNSFVWLTTPRFNAFVETLWSRTSDRGGHDSQLTVSPGIRWSYDFPSKLQIVPGIAFPITNHGGGKSVFLYLSFEHPFITQP